MKLLYVMFIVITALVLNLSIVFADANYELTIQCDKENDMTACVEVAQMYIYVDNTTALKYLEKACDGGNMYGCGTIGDMYQRATGVKQSYQKARKFYIKSCNGGEMAGCGALGDLYAKGLGVDFSYAKSMKLYKKACDGGKEMACDRLDDPFVGSFEDLSIKCDEKDLDACTQLASQYGQEEDYDYAFKYIKKSCDGGLMIGCASEGYLYQEGIGVKKNLNKALKLYNKSCNGGEIDVCLVLGELYEDGETIDINLGKALQLYKKACDSKNYKGCQKFLELYKSECSTDPKKFCKKYKK